MLTFAEKTHELNLTLTSNNISEQTFPCLIIYWLVTLTEVICMTNPLIKITSTVNHKLLYRNTNSSRFNIYQYICQVNEFTQADGNIMSYTSIFRYTSFISDISHTLEINYKEVKLTAYIIQNLTFSVSYILSTHSLESIKTIN